MFRFGLLYIVWSRFHDFLDQSQLYVRYLLKSYYIPYSVQNINIQQKYFRLGSVTMWSEFKIKKSLKFAKFVGLVRFGTLYLLHHWLWLFQPLDTVKLRINLLTSAVVVVAEASDSLHYDSSHEEDTSNSLFVQRPLGKTRTGMDNSLQNL